METIGLILMNKLRVKSPFSTSPVDSNELLSRVEADLNQLRDIAMANAQSALEDATVLKPHVDRVVVIPGTDEYANQVTRFVLSLEHGTRVLVTDLRDVLPKPLHKPFIREARTKGILVVPLSQKSLLKVDASIALELQGEVMASSLVNRIAEAAADEHDYQILKDLMLEGLSVPQIVKETGLSRSTVFRMRRKYEDRLREDVPNFVPQPLIMGVTPNSSE